MIQERSEQIALAYERDVLMFAIVFKTRRVYVTRWTSTVRRNDETYLRLDYNYKLFSFENRGESYKEAKKHEDGTVSIYDLSRLAKMPDEVFHSLPYSENTPIAEIFRDTFKEFRCIGNEPK